MIVGTHLHGRRSLCVRIAADGSQAILFYNWLQTSTRPIFWEAPQAVTLQTFIKFKNRMTKRGKTCGSHVLHCLFFAYYKLTRGRNQQCRRLQKPIFLLRKCCTCLVLRIILRPITLNQLSELQNYNPLSELSMFRANGPITAVHHAIVGFFQRCKVTLQTGHTQQKHERKQSPSISFQIKMHV